MSLRTIDDILARLPKPQCPLLEKPTYYKDGSHDSINLGFAVKAMKQHTTDEGWQLFEGLKETSFMLAGYGCDIDTTDVELALRMHNPTTVVMQDKREWDNPIEYKTSKRIPSQQMHDIRFKNVEALRDRQDIFKLTIIKDAHQRPEYHRQSAEEIRCNAWLTYYHPRIVAHLAPYVRHEHLIRMYHTIDKERAPVYTSYREGGVLSGAMQPSVYPLRVAIRQWLPQLPNMILLPHPGYQAQKCHTYEYMRTLSQFKVAICTSSIYGYALRKIIEATAAGCIVITDLPEEDELPEIDGNLYRVSPMIEREELSSILKDLYAHYTPERQEFYSEKAKAFYDYREQAKRTVRHIESLRKTY